jgi:transketolase
MLARVEDGAIPMNGLDSNWQERARRTANGIRRRVLEHTLKHNGGYLSQACSSAEILAALYTRVMKLGPSRAPLTPRPFAGVPGPANPNALTGADYNGPKAPDLDRFVFSPVHYALVLYSALIEVGRLGEDALGQFNTDGSTMELIGAEHSPGHEVTAGSLGQAISQAGGIALARKLNGQCCDGAMSSVMSIDPIGERLEAFGAEVRQVDGHDLDALAAPAELPRRGKPLVVLAKTDPCRDLGLLKARAPKLHYVRFKSDEERRAYEEALARFEKES